MVKPAEMNCFSYAGCLDQLSGFLRSVGLYHRLLGVVGRSWGRLFVAFVTPLVSEPSKVLSTLPLAWLLITTGTTHCGFQQFTRCT